LTADAYHALPETSANLVLPASGLNGFFAGSPAGMTGIGVYLPQTGQVVPAVRASPHGVLQTLQIPKW